MMLPVRTMITETIRMTMVIVLSPAVVQDCESMKNKYLNIYTMVSVLIEAG